MRVEGRPGWLHVACTGLLCHFRLGESRGDAVADAVGIAARDFWKSAICSFSIVFDIVRSKLPRRNRNEHFSARNGEASGLYLETARKRNRNVLPRIAVPDGRAPNLFSSFDSAMLRIWRSVAGPTRFQCRASPSNPSNSTTFESIGRRKISVPRFAVERSDELILSASVRRLTVAQIARSTV